MVSGDHPTDHPEREESATPHNLIADPRLQAIVDRAAAYSDEPLVDVPTEDLRAAIRAIRAIPNRDRLHPFTRDGLRNAAVTLVAELTLRLALEE